MAAYAGFVEHTDEQVGRLAQFLKERERFDNTLIFLLSDNGGAPEAGVEGNFTHPYSDPMTPAEMLERIDEIGGADTQPLYQRPWAMVSSAPYKFYKLWPYRGGVQTPFLVSWPREIRAPGLRGQFVDAGDITPTVLDVTGVAPPACFYGVRQMAMHGESLRSTFNDAESPSPRHTQYFELWGSRSIYQRGWKAIAIHEPGASFDEDAWELYHVAEDPTEVFDLSAQFPERVDVMKALWWEEAEKYGALPLLEAPRGRVGTYGQHY